MTQLEENLQSIYNEAKAKIVPENIRKDTTIFGITGTLEESKPEDLDEQLQAQDKIITKLQEALKNKAAGGGKEVLHLGLPSKIQVEVPNLPEYKTFILSEEVKEKITDTEMIVGTVVDYDQPYAQLTGNTSFYSQERNSITVPIQYYIWQFSNCGLKIWNGSKDYDFDAITIPYEKIEKDYKAKILLFQDNNYNTIIVDDISNVKITTEDGEVVDLFTMSGISPLQWYNTDLIGAYLKDGHYKISLKQGSKTYSSESCEFEVTEFTPLVEELNSLQIPAIASRIKWAYYEPQGSWGTRIGDVKFEIIQDNTVIDTKYDRLFYLFEPEQDYTIRVSSEGCITKEISYQELFNGEDAIGLQPDGTTTPITIILREYGASAIEKPYPFLEREHVKSFEFITHSTGEVIPLEYKITDNKYIRSNIPTDFESGYIHIRVEIPGYNTIDDAYNTNIYDPSAAIPCSWLYYIQKQN